MVELGYKHKWEDGTVSLIPLPQKWIKERVIDNYEMELSRLIKYALRLLKKEELVLVWMKTAI